MQKGFVDEVVLAVVLLLSFVTLVFICLISSELWFKGLVLIIVSTAAGLNILIYLQEASPAEK